MALTDLEDRLLDGLIRIKKDEGFVLAMSSFAQQTNSERAMAEFIEQNSFANEQEFCEAIFTDLLNDPPWAKKTGTKEREEKMRTEKPIFDIIEDSIADGRLPDDFVIHDDGYMGDPRLKMAPGAMDGVCIYHMYPGDPDDEGRELIAKAVQAAAAGDENAYELFESLGEKYRAINIIDNFQNYIREHAEELDQKELLSFAFDKLIFGGRTLECVKYGLVITELYGEFDDEFKWIFCHLGLYDEFTIFVVFNMMTWESGNEDIFELAKRVDSWGKIHAVKRLEPSSQEIRDWILYNGVDNEVMGEYLALTCMEKSAASERLKGQLTKEEFSAISHILSYMFDEGPVPGISELPDAEETLENYLAHAEQMELELEDYEAVQGIKEYATDENQLPQLVERANQILYSARCMACVASAVAEGNGVRLAKALEIPYKEQLLNLMQKDFKGAYHWCSTLMDDPEYVDSVLAIFRDKVPPESLEQDPRDEFEFGDEYEADRQINFLLQNLDDYPGKGMDYLVRAISAPTVRSRSLTVRTLKAWVSEAGQPLQDCYPELYKRLEEAYHGEFRKDLKADMKRLLDCSIDFTDETEDEDDESEGDLD